MMWTGGQEKSKRAEKALKRSFSFSVRLCSEEKEDMGKAGDKCIEICIHNLDIMVCTVYRSLAR